MTNLLASARLRVKHIVNGMAHSRKSNGTDQEDGVSDSQTDQPKKRSGGDIAAIFIHAGAGFHSIQNENVHLSACNE